MATINDTSLSITDVAKRMNASGTIQSIAELLDQQNGIVSDIPWVEGDTAGGHMSVQRTSLPTWSTRAANAGVAPSKSTTAQILEAPEVIEGWCVIDEIVARYGGDVAGKRMSEAVAFAESGNQTVADRFIYGNGSTTPGQMNGLAVRYASTSGTNGANIIKGGGSGSDNISFWLVGWAPGKVYGWYPKGSPGGLQVTDWGKQVRTNSDGTEQVVYKEQWQWSFGLAVDDWRYVVRGCNIDLSVLIANSSPADIYQMLSLATHAIPNLSACNPKIYMNRTLLAWLDVQAQEAVKVGGGLTYSNVDGRTITSFRGIEIKTLDRLTEAETPAIS